jgi:hypothetical protein
LGAALRQGIRPAGRLNNLVIVRHPVLEVTATVIPFENRRRYSLRVLRTGEPRGEQANF